MHAFSSITSSVLVVAVGEPLGHFHSCIVWIVVALPFCTPRMSEFWAESRVQSRHLLRQCYASNLLAVCLAMEFCRSANTSYYQVVDFRHQVIAHVGHARDNKGSPDWRSFINTMITAAKFQ